MNFKIEIPNEANLLIHKLQEHGYKAYIVGGCVRDSILGREPHDWDICTSATPEEMQKIFNKLHYRTIETGLKHGTLTVLMNGIPYEITTFRKETGYSDNRHPDKVEFISDIIEDLARRDFTINAMAYNNEEGLIDPFGGQYDLEKKIIKCVGYPHDRFNEDALRIIRAIRFSSQFEFDIDINTSMAIHSLRDKLKNISQERITNEFCKIMQTDNPANNLYLYTDVFLEFIPEIAPIMGYNQRNPYHDYDVFNHTLYALQNCKSDDLITRLAIFFHDFGKPDCATPDKEDLNRLHFYGHGKISAEIAKDIMKRMKFDNNTISKVCELVYYHDSKFEVDNSHIKRWLNKMGPEQFIRLIDIREADIRGQSKNVNPERLEKIQKIKKILLEIITQHQCYSMKNLAINGNDLTKMGFKSGKELGNLLNKLLERVIDGDIQNDKLILLSEATKYKNNSEINQDQEYEM